MKKMIYAVLFLMLSFNASANLNEIFGNQDIGDKCSSDYQCESLCCDSKAGQCAPHGTNGESCAKAPGQSCISSEFCKAEFVSVCKIYKTGTSADGSVMCALRCPPTLVNGSCVNNLCEAPQMPPIPPFDPADCSNAI